MFKGNNQDCICHKPNNKHTKQCDAYRLSEFQKKMAGVIFTGCEDWRDEQ